MKEGQGSSPCCPLPSSSDSAGHRAPGLYRKCSISIVSQNNQHRLSAEPLISVDEKPNTLSQDDETSSVTSYGIHKNYEGLTAHTSLATLQKRLLEPPEILQDSTNSKEKLTDSAALLCTPFSAFQEARRSWVPTLPRVFENLSFDYEEVEASSPANLHAEKREIFDFLPKTAEKYRRVVAVHTPEEAVSGEIAEGDCTHQESPLNNTSLSRVGVIFSGGPAPGGHNVISGLFDYLQRKDEQPVIIGFLGGINGLLEDNCKLLTASEIHRYRNQGGFEMILSGRGKFRDNDDMLKAMQVCKRHKLKGLVVIGGDGTNSNAALLAEYFEASKFECFVIGVPKTIDGDLKGDLIETTFGFDTAAKTYSEMIGNLCNDARCSKDTYHFIRVMGRSASHLVLECALQTRPNLAFIGEEVNEKKTSLQAAVESVVAIMKRRLAQGKKYGVILFPEGLIEFFPEMQELIKELNELIEDKLTFDASKLKKSRALWDFLPTIIQEQLLLDRESSGYIQVAKIATEKLFILLTEEIISGEGSFTDVLLTPHYFGYEGRCAMPSNFDANYCYALGFNAGALIEHKMMGYMSTLKNLGEPPDLWQPMGVPFWELMSVIQGDASLNKKRFPSITRGLVDLEARQFQVFSQFRDKWVENDLYRCPGPIQFDGVCADLRNYTVSLTDLTDFEGVSDNEVLASSRCVYPIRLQAARMETLPAQPPICEDLYATAVPGTKTCSIDPYTQRQICANYPYLSNQANIQWEISTDQKLSRPASSLRVGIAFLSRQFPGANNIVCGLFNRLKLLSGRLVAFGSLSGLLEGRGTLVKQEDVQCMLNQGGIEYYERVESRTLLKKQDMKKIHDTCVIYDLDGLVIPGSAYAISIASLLAEYFLSIDSQVSVIGVPATGSNNLVGSSVEVCVGFDSSTKMYSSLIGNVLSDAASMPKYWHFIRLMGRRASMEVLECAFQTHPNMVIIAEEYGAADKTLLHVVNDICDLILARAKEGKNFGTVLIPDALLLHLPNMKNLFLELANLVHHAKQLNKLGKAQEWVLSLDESSNEVLEWYNFFTPWSFALLRSFPKFIRKEFLTVDMREVRFEYLQTEELLALMVKHELGKRKGEARIYSQSVSIITHFFGYQGRCSMPSVFDATLAYTYGHAACILIESGLTGQLCSVRGLCGEVCDWSLHAIPFVSLMRNIPNIVDNAGIDVDEDTAIKVVDLPIIPSAEVNLNGSALRAVKNAMEKWGCLDCFCNPGPIQFSGLASLSICRLLVEEQMEYFVMLKHVEYYSQLLSDMCRFGVSKEFLKYAFVALNGMLVLGTQPRDLTNVLPNLGDTKEYEIWKSQKVKRHEGVSVQASTSFLRTFAKQNSTSFD